MKIIHVTATFPPYYAGTGNVCYHNALGLARRGHRLHVITAATPLPPDYHDPPELHVRRLPVLLRVGNAPLLGGMLPLPACDLVHLHYPFYFGAEAVLWACLCQRIPYVLTYHQDVMLTGGRDLAVRLHHHLLGRLILRRARRVFATSADYADHSRLRPLLARRPAQLAVLANGVDVQHFTPHPAAGCLRQRHNLDPSTPILLFVGGLDQAHYFKGIPTLLAAVAQLSAPRPALILIGTGELHTSYAQLATQHGITAIFAGRVPTAELPAYYRLADLLLLPSTTRGEAFGMVLIEALACGTPVIASDLPGVRSVIRNGVDGILVPPGDVAALAAAIDRLLADPQQRATMGAAGRAKVQQQYAWEVLIPQLEQHYREVLADAG